MKKILILSANPRQTRHLRLDEEIRDIEEAIRRSIGRSQYEIRSRLAARSEDIRRALLEEKPQIVHFCGHGEANGNLLLEDIGGQKKPVTPDALAKLFELCAEYVECVLVNACFSEKASEAISQYINYSIGMNQAIGEKSTIKFATGFYDAIGAKQSIEIAYKFGVNAIQLENLPGVQIPVFKEGANFRQTIFMNRATSEAIDVFFAYAREDETLRDELAKYLKQMERSGEIVNWYDRMIGAGGHIENEINERLKTAHIILLLLSVDFLNSDFLWDVGVKTAMQRHDAGQARVIPIILRPVDLFGTPFRGLKSLPRDGKPVIKWKNREEAFVDITQGIRATVKEIVAKRASTS